MSSPEKYPELEDIRKNFKARLSTGRLRWGYSQDSREESKIRIRQNMFERNDARDAQQWKTLSQRPRSIVSRKRLRRHHRIDATSHECEVLGPAYCSRCVRRAQQRKFHEQVLNVFPVVNLRASLVQNAHAANDVKPAHFRLMQQLAGAHSRLPKPERSILVRRRRHELYQGTRVEFSDAEHPSNCQLHQRVMNKTKRRFVLRNGDVINNFEPFPVSDGGRDLEQSDLSRKKAQFRL